MRFRWGTAGFVILAVAGLARGSTAAADDAIQWSGFALVRAASSEGSLEQEHLSSQLHLGVDWLPSTSLGGHLHLIARTDDGESRRGNAGVAEAYLEANLHPKETRLRIRAGALFLPTSRENVDALWESPYSVTPSALNSWFGEEFRPVGIDVTWIRKSLMVGGTIFRGNDTFGALPPVRGWALRDHWTLLGEWVPVDETYFTSVSAETDHRIGWSSRVGWTGRRSMLQFTHIDNRSDGREYGALYNWGTKFDVAAVEFSGTDWTIAGEAGWGPTFLVVGERTFVSDIRASYLLVSRRFSRGRATIRGDWYANEDARAHAVTVAYFWTPPGRVRTGIEALTTGNEHRVLLEVRARFSGR